MNRTLIDYPELGFEIKAKENGDLYVDGPEYLFTDMPDNASEVSAWLFRQFANGKKMAKDFNLAHILYEYVADTGTLPPRSLMSFEQRVLASKFYKDTERHPDDVDKPDAPSDPPGTFDRVGRDMLDELANGGIKHDDDKLPWDLYAWDSAAATTRVLQFGAEKYAPRNWEKGMAWSRPYAALIRHITAWWNGEDIDPESGINHLHHAACCIMFLQAYHLRQIGQDNRPKGVRDAIHNDESEEHDERDTKTLS